MWMQQQMPGGPQTTQGTSHTTPLIEAVPRGGGWRDIVESSWKLEHWARETRYTATYTVSLWALIYLCVPIIFFMESLCLALIPPSRASVLPKLS